MNLPSIKNLMVVVIPTEIETGITPTSSVDEILSCASATTFFLPDYFQAQNDSEIDLQHWSFLIDIDTKTILNGMEFEEDEREIKIHKIKSIIAEWGATTSMELELESSPCLNSIGNGKKNISELVEGFYGNYVETTTYQDELELDTNMYSYESLPDDIIDEILLIMEDYDADMCKTMDNIQS